MSETLFYVIGIALVLAAVVVSALGLRSERFPSRAAMAGGTAALLGLVGATAAFAVLQARDEQEHRRAELASEAEEAESEVAAAEREEGAPAVPGAKGAEPPAPAEAGGGPATLELTSPEDGSLSFEPNALEATAGTITIEYDNPSQVPHNVAIESPDGETLQESETAPSTLLTATSDLVPGEYIYFCSVPGHRDGGMEGTLTVK